LAIPLKFQELLRIVDVKCKTNDAYAQTYNIIERVEKVLHELNASLKD
jgi:hypothetical protein